MASSKIEVVNKALAALGEPALTSLSQTSLNAETANANYDSVKRDLLGKHDWRFAAKKQTLTQEVGAPLNEWSYKYLMPPDFVRVTKLEPRADYEIFGDRLYTDAPALALDYVHFASESLFSPPFVSLLALELAVRMCMVITGDMDLKHSLQNDARFAFAAAQAADSTQRPNRRIEDAPFINCRF